MRSSIFVLACGSFSCGLWDLVPWPGREPGPLPWEHGVLATGPPGKSPDCLEIHKKHGFKWEGAKYYAIAMPWWMLLDFQGGTSGKESVCWFRRCKWRGFHPRVRKILRSRKWWPTPIFLPGKFHGQSFKWEGAQYLGHLHAMVDSFTNIRPMLWHLWKVKVKVAQLYPTLWDPMNYTVHGILQAIILEWVTLPFSRGSSQPRNQTRVSCIAGGFFTSSATREALRHL